MSQPVQIDWIHVSDYWDEPISGWIRVGGRYLFFKRERLYGSHYRVFDIQRRVKVAYLCHIRNFRHIAGWHFDYRPGEARRLGAKPGFKKFYELPRPIQLRTRRHGTLVGRTDLRTVTFT